MRSTSTTRSSPRSSPAAAAPATAVAGEGVDRIAAALRADAIEVERIGDDVLIGARLQGVVTGCSRAS